MICSMSKPCYNSLFAYISLLFSSVIDVNPFNTHFKASGSIMLIKMLLTVAFGTISSSLILYTTHQLKLNETTSISILASFLAYVQIIKIGAGWLGDRILCHQNVLLMGSILTIVGCFLISIPIMECFYWGISLLTLGCGFSVAINCLLTQLFQSDSGLRESIFIINYSITNIGWLIGYFLAGYFQLNFHYQTLFITGGLAAVLALLFSMSNSRYAKYSASNNINSKNCAMIMLPLLILYALFRFIAFSNALIIIITLLAILMVIRYGLKQTQVENKNKTFAFLILALLSFIFWSLHHLGPMLLTLFIERYVDKSLGGFDISPQWFQMINPVIITLVGPCLMMVFRIIRSKGFHLWVPTQFSCAFFLMGISFLVLSAGIFFTNSKGHMNFNWLITCYLLQGMGELFIAPIGFAVIGQLVPRSLQGMMTGIWMISIASSATLSGNLSIMSFAKSSSIDSFMQLFAYIGCFSIFIAFIMLWIRSPLLMMMPKEMINLSRARHTV